MDIACIKDATRQDPTLSKTIEFIQTNNWTALEKQDKMPTGVNIDELHALYKLRDELTVSSDANILLRGNRVVIPNKLRAQAVKFKAFRIILSRRLCRKNRRLF
jgi:alpha-L-arabinofuranosidase